MKFTKQDLWTFLIGLGAAVGITIFEALVRSEEITEDPWAWGTNLLVGVLAAVGRYGLTELTQRGFGKG